MESILHFLLGSASSEEQVKFCPQQTRDRYTCMLGFFHRGVRARVRKGWYRGRISGQNLSGTFVAIFKIKFLMNRF